MTIKETDSITFDTRTYEATYSGKDTEEIGSLREKMASIETYIHFLEHSLPDRDAGLLVKKVDIEFLGTEGVEISPYGRRNHTKARILRFGSEIGGEAVNLDTNFEDKTSTVQIEGDFFMVRHLPLPK